VSHRRLVVAFVSAFCVAAVGLATAITPAAAADEKPTATEVGVTPTEIHIAVVADVDTHHHTRMGFKSQASHDQWAAGDRAFREKWSL